MKIWKKFVLFMIAIISIVLTYSRYYIVKNNFLHSIENVSYQNSSKHILEKYTLENNTQPQQISEGAIKDQQPEQSGEANQ